MKSVRLILSIQFLLIVNSSAQAKGYPDKIVIQGADLAHRIEITDRATLGKFSPWYGQFINWNNGPVTKPDQTLSYEK